ncbi:MAG TPA: hypothetical protein VGP82_18780 [Ktedonobacterales bacterium]|nr:hypothetical protein [Ktedonobacterales bacterium]
MQTLPSRTSPLAETQHHDLALLDVLRVRGLLYLRQTRWQDADAVLEQALSLARGMPQPYAEATLLYVFGQLRITKGEPAPAREKRGAALGICDRLDEGLYRPHIERALKALN